MGACASSPPEDPTVSAIDLALAARLKTYIATHPDVHAAKSLHKVALNFGGMLKSFEALRVVFARADADSNGTIEYHEFLSACLELQMTKGQNQELLKEVYATADVNGDGLVDFREFAMALTLAFLIVAVKGDCVTADDSTTDVRAPDDGFGLGNGTTETETRRLTHAALDKVLEAWLVFDTDGSGFIQKANVHHALATFADQKMGGSHELGASSKLISCRFGEMNFGQHDRISFQEFLYAVEEWCGLADEEEE